MVGRGDTDHGMGAWGQGLCPSLPASHCGDGERTGVALRTSLPPTSLQDSWAEALWTRLPWQSLTAESNDQAGMSQPATQVTMCRCVRVDGIHSRKTE